jgi:hypothetical protein
MSISVADALKTFRKPALIAFTAIAGLVIGAWANATFFPTTSPDQPIQFSHKIHAGDNQIPCQHCHVYAARSPSAGVPSVNKCMNCHKAVAIDRPEIVKVRGYWERNEPIPWLKVHDLADFVYFPHKRHVQAGVACQHCHGPVETMEKVKREAPLTMPWCVDCHRANEVQNGTDCWTCHK